MLCLTPLPRYAPPRSGCKKALQAHAKHSPCQTCSARFAPVTLPAPTTGRQEDASPLHTPRIAGRAHRKLRAKCRAALRKLAEGFELARDLPVATRTCGNTDVAATLTRHRHRVGHCMSYPAHGLRISTRLDVAHDTNTRTLGGMNGDTTRTRGNTDVAATLTRHRHRVGH